MIQRASVVPEMVANVAKPASPSLTSTAQGSDAFEANLMAYGAALPVETSRDESKGNSTSKPSAAVDERPSALSAAAVIASEQATPDLQNLSITSSNAPGAHAVSSCSLARPSSPLTLPTSISKAATAPKSVQGASQSANTRGGTSRGFPFTSGSGSSPTSTVLLSIETVPGRAFDTAAEAQPDATTTEAQAQPSAGLVASEISGSAAGRPQGILPTAIVSSAAPALSTVLATKDRIPASSAEAPNRKPTKSAVLKGAVSQSAAHLLLSAGSALATPFPVVALPQLVTSKPGVSSTASSSERAISALGSPGTIAKQAPSSVPQAGAAGGASDLRGNVEAAGLHGAHSTQAPAVPSMPSHAASPTPLTGGGEGTSGRAPSSTSGSVQVSASNSVSSSTSDSAANVKANEQPGSLSMSSQQAGPVALAGIHIAGAAIGVSGSAPSQFLATSDRPAASQPGTGALHDGTVVCHQQGDAYGVVPAALRATPTTLEVGVSGGSQGWLKIRAEVHGESVSATLSSTSSSGTKQLQEQLPALNQFLGTQNISAATSVVPRAALDGDRQSSMQSFQHDGSSRQNPSQPQNPPQLQSQSKSATEDGSASASFSALEYPLLSLPVISSGPAAHAGSWLNVLA